VRDVVLGREVRIDVAVLVLEVSPQIHEEVVDDVGLVALADGVEGEAGSLGS